MSLSGTDLNEVESFNRLDYTENFRFREKRTDVDSGTKKHRSRSRSDRELNRASPGGGTLQFHGSGTENEITYVPRTANAASPDLCARIRSHF